MSLSCTLIIFSAITPTKSGDVIIRHNALRDLIDDFGNDAKLSPVLEKKGILGNTTGRRPGDVTFEKWAEGKGLAIDVAVTSPLAATYVRNKETCEWHVATQKHGKYDASLQAPIISLVRLCLRHWVQSIRKERNYFA